jgi:hypothetical protein
MVRKSYFPSATGLKRPGRKAIVLLPYMPAGFVPHPTDFVTNLCINGMYLHFPMYVCI